MRKQQKKTNILLTIFFKYWLSAILLVVLITLIRQNFWINEFPFSLIQKQAVIDKNKHLNALLSEDNKNKSISIKAHSETGMEILESQARYRFGLIKKGERFYQINQSTSDSK
ncbi:hypothetical protein SPBRAN_1060 [uncultured Candidatus Thioglobus sp.]|nr:hypothetical protein SPBRAN_1060 [uncultured Candidatus Thioglobus sp.]